MNYRLVSSNIGVMLLLLAGVMGVCLGLGHTMDRLPGHNDATALTGWELSLAITGLSGILCLIFGKGSSKTATMLRKDAIGLVGIGWAVCSVFAAVPYMLCEPGLGFSAAVFESVSGLTTTGASAFSDLEKIPKTVVLWRSLTQWMGGMGILAMFVLFSASLGASGRSVFQTESSMHAHESVGTTMKQTARRLWRLYLGITLVCTAGLWAMEMTPFQAVNHAMATVSTGGFGTENSSVDGFGVPVKIWITVFMVICGVSFPLYLTVFRAGGVGKIRQQEEAWVFLGILLVSSVGLIVIRGAAGSLGDWFVGSVDTCFNVVSLATSTGFAVGDYDKWPLAAKGVLLLLIFIGGCAGSTAGGIKVSRCILLLKLIRTEIKRVFRPNLVVHHKINGRSVQPGARGQVMLIFVVAIVSAGAGSYLLVALEPSYSVDGCISAVVSSLGNTGPAFVEFGPTHNFSSLSGTSMWLLSLLMILGRLEYLAVLVLFSRQLWKRY